MDFFKGMHRSPDVNGGGKEAVKTNEEIANSFQYFNYNKESKNLFTPDFLKQFDLSGLENCAVIAAEMGDKHDGFEKSVNIALELLSQNETRPILLYGFHSIDGFKKLVPKSNLLFAKENVRYLQLPFSNQDLEDVFTNTNRQKIEGAVLQEIKDKEIDKKVGSWLHIIDRSHEQVINEVKDFFPTLVDKSDDEIVAFLQNVRQNVPEVMKGKDIEGVYCDIEGTLLNNGQVNESILLKLKEFAEQGKQITLWTDGDVEYLQTILDQNGITYPLKSKIDFAGATAEIVIDNDDNNTFSAKTKIFAREFIKV